jgi:uncharacterized protein (DUF1330 family)
MSLRRLVLAGIIGVSLGAVVAPVLYAQAGPPAYLVAEIDVTDAALYKQYLDKGGPLYAKFTGRFLVRGGTIETFAGEPPKRSVIAVFDSLAQARAFRDSPAYQELVPLRDRASTFRAYIVEGVAN